MKNNDLIQVVFNPQEKETAKQTLRTLLEIIASKAPVLSNNDRQTQAPANLQLALFSKGFVIPTTLFEDKKTNCLTLTRYATTRECWWQFAMPLPA